MKTYNFKINGHDYKVDINSIEAGKAKVNVNGKEYEVEMETPAAPLQAAPAAAAPAAPSQQTATPAGPEKPSGAAKAVVSPLPGVILELCVAKGDKVKAGDKVAVLEAMKMENDIESEFDGTVTAVLVGKGDSVLEGAKIIEIA